VSQPAPTPKPRRAPRAAQARIHVMLSRSEWIQPRNVFGSGFELFRVEGEEEDDGVLLVLVLLLPEIEGDALGDDDG